MWSLFEVTLFKIQDVTNKPTTTTIQQHLKNIITYQLWTSCQNYLVAYKTGNILFWHANVSEEETSRGLSNTFFCFRKEKNGDCYFALKLKKKIKWHASVMLPQRRFDLANFGKLVNRQKKLRHRQEWMYIWEIAIDFFLLQV